MDSMGIYSTIRYTRLLDNSRSIAVLEDIAEYPLLDLELLRRRLDTWPPNRAAAEVWLLLNRHPGEEALHEWAAWYFDQRRLFPESARLLRDAARKGMSGTWLDLHRGLALIREGKIAEGEKILREAGADSQGPAGSPDWRIFANLGRIYESRRQISAALEAYETAAVLVLYTAAAQIQLRLSRCLEALGRRQESRYALERALEFDPDDLNIRRELRRFDSR
jgi:tetratricopeptide (TPR) repeat protein